MQTKDKDSLKHDKRSRLSSETSQDTKRPRSVPWLASFLVVVAPRSNPWL